MSKSDVARNSGISDDLNLQRKPVVTLGGLLVMTLLNILVAVCVAALPPRHTVADELAYSVAIAIALMLFGYSALTYGSPDVPLKRKIGLVVKRCLDIVFVFVAMWGYSLFMVPIALAIKLDSKGPLMYRSRRIGQHGEPFDAFRFRTTLCNTSVPTVSRVGRFLRGTFLDEFPQMLNILEGTMSLIGPHPRPVSFRGTPLEPDIEVLELKPGLTGLAQVTHSYSSEESPYSPQWNAKDLEYVRNWSLLLDLKILSKTMWVVVKDR